MKPFALLTVVLLLLATVTTAVPPSAPRQIAYQGRLTDAAGAPLPDGAKSIRFIIWNHATNAAPANEIWNSGALTVTTTSGLFSVLLGASHQPALTPAMMTDTVRWLGITVGADPEISPRTRLISVPYAFNAQNAAFADSALYVGDHYVKLVGDTMTGDLSWDGDGLGRDAWLRTGLAGGGRLSLLDDGTETAVLFGDGSYGSVGLNNNTGNRTALLDATRSGGGLLNLNQQDGTSGVVVSGGTTSDGSTLSMYSAGGTNTIKLDADIIGNSAAVLPDSAISSAEMWNEPGIVTNDNGTGSVVLTTTMQDIVTVEITIPASGYITLDGKATGWTSGTSDQNYGYVQIDETAGGTSGTAPYVTFFGGLDMPTADIFNWPIYVTRSYYKSTAGSYTFRIEAMVNTSQGAGAVTRVFYGMLRATYIPTAYGTMNTMVPASEAALFEYSTLIAAEQAAPPGITTQPMYRVDLRELELRTAKAEAEAERARRELLEARMQSEAAEIRR